MSDSVKRRSSLSSVPGVNYRELREAHRVESDLADASLLRLLPGYRGQGAGIYLVYPSRFHPSAALKAFMGFLAEEAANNDWAAS
jgi:DNA-binding transcriptional LysR family regulator